MNTSMQYCGGCEFTDGLVYASNPPQCKCTFTGKFHYMGDKCDAPSNKNATDHMALTTEKVMKSNNMVTLNVNINVPEADFKKLCVDNINDLPKEQMTEILLKAVEVALIRDRKDPVYDIGASILVQPKKRGAGYEPTELMKSIVNNIDTDKYFKDIADEIGQYIHDNYRQLIKEYMVDAIAQLLFTDERRYDIMNLINNKV